MADLFSKISWFDKVLALVSYLVALVATGSILASIYNSMNERRREIAILRALGARRRIIFGAISWKPPPSPPWACWSAFAFYWAIMTGAAGVIRAQTGIVLDPFKFNPVMLWAPAALIALGALGRRRPRRQGLSHRRGRASRPHLLTKQNMNYSNTSKQWISMRLFFMSIFALALGLLAGCGNHQDPLFR